MKIQQALNTNSMRSKNSVTITIDNFNSFTWQYIIMDLPEHGVNLMETKAVVKSVIMEKDSLVVQKWRDAQQWFHLHLPEHFQLAQNLFGNTVGLGVRVVVPCSLGRSRGGKVEENYHEVSVGDTINVVPFAVPVMPRELLERGLILRYIPQTSSLSVTIRFSRVNGVERIKEHLRLRGVSTSMDDDSANSIGSEEGDVFPLHSTTEVDGKLVQVINLRDLIVTFSDNSTATFDEIFNYFRGLLNG